jgi:hypothetical protein
VSNPLSFAPKYALMPSIAQISSGVVIARGPVPKNLAPAMQPTVSVIQTCASRALLVPILQGVMGSFTRSAEMIALL